VDTDTDGTYILDGEAIADLRRQVDELRAILAPLLDEPLRNLDPDAQLDICIFCLAARWVDPSGRADVDGVFAHRPDCPVLRRDALLGRS
jgi:hypothetical protein